MECHIYSECQTINSNDEKVRKPCKRFGSRGKATGGCNGALGPEEGRGARVKPKEGRMPQRYAVLRGYRVK